MLLSHELLAHGAWSRVLEGSPCICWGREPSKVDHPSFDVFFACVVLLNSILIGVDVENTLSCRDQPVCDARPAWLQATQISCTVLFVLELVIRVTASGIQIFCSEDWLWILLDVLIVALSVWEIVVDIALLVEPNQEAMSEGVSGIASLKAFRIIRLTRILKTAQLMRVFRFVMALRTLVQSVLHTMKALMWALLLLLLIVYAPRAARSQVLLLGILAFLLFHVLCPWSNTPIMHWGLPSVANYLDDWSLPHGSW